MNSHRNINQDHKKTENHRSQKARVVLLTRSIAFPEGMAPTQRVKLIARGLAENGLDVSVLCTQVSERPPVIENKEPRGIYNGIPYEYTTGTTIRSPHFWMRRWHELRGIVVAIYRLIQLKNDKRPCCVYYYGNILSNDPSRSIFYLVTQILRLPLVTEVTERPWTLASKQIGTRFLSPLRGVQGVVVISSFLRKWAEAEKITRHLGLKIFELPILVDVNEQKPADYPLATPNVLFAGSPNYDDTIQFILEAMTYVWQDYPNCVLVITGCRAGDPASEKLTKLIREQRLEGRIELAGYLTRQELLERYAQAWALLIPLFDDIRSKARFPTKLGEYLASSRPVVTNSVGEVARFFTDRESIYMCPPGNASLYAEKILDALKHREKAIGIGVSGRETAKRFFHYATHTKHLKSFLETLVWGE